MRSIFTAFFIVLLMPLFLLAQTFTLYTSENSDLPHNQVYCIAFDNDKNIWFGGQRNPGTGVAQVSMLSNDYSQWTVYDAQDADLGLTDLEDRVYYIAVDNDNNKWLCTHYGVSYQMADGAAGYVDFTFDLYTRTVQTDSEGNVYISMRDPDTRDSARIWISDNMGESWTTQWFLEDIGISLSQQDARPEIYDLREDSQGNMWLCTWYGVTLYKDGVWTSFGDIEGYWTYCLTVDRNDNAWVPDNDTQELYQLETDGSITIHDSNDVDILKYPINDLEASGDGNLWLATDGGGLIQMKADMSYIQHNVETTAGQIPQDNITHLEILDGVIWLSTGDSGIVRIDGAVSAIEQPEVGLQPVSFALDQNYPNPFNPTTSITFHLEKAAETRVLIYNALGQVVHTLASGYYKAGSYTLTWNGIDNQGNSVASGIYLYEIVSGNFHDVKKMVFMK
jgi:ligand-binding sensor domain-containing protein